MISESSTVRVRIDVPLAAGATLYFFLRESHQSWDPWWETLLSHVSSLAVPDLQWSVTPEGDRRLARLVLSEAQTQTLLDVLREAPAKEVAEHRTLAKTIAELSRSGSRAAVVFFRSIDEANS